MRIKAKCRISTCLFSSSVKLKSFLFKIAVWSDLPSSGVAVLLDYVYLGRARLSLENGLSALEVSRRLHMKGQDLTSDLTHWLMKNVHFWFFHSQFGSVLPRIWFSESHFFAWNDLNILEFLKRIQRAGIFQQYFSKLYHFYNYINFILIILHLLYLYCSTLRLTPCYWGLKIRNFRHFSNCNYSYYNFKNLLWQQFLRLPIKVWSSLRPLR